MKKVCVVTGAANGIGKETILYFLRKGYLCIGIDRDEKAVNRFLDEMKMEERKHLHFSVMDLTADFQTGELATRLFSYVPQEIHLTLVNNIGGSRESRKAFEESTWEGFMDTIAFNLKPLHQITRACIPIMKKNQYGRIVNISSISARKALSNIGAEYPAAKSAIIGLSRHLANELVKEKIWVNTVCPGIVATERMVNRWANREAKINERMLATIPMGRLAEPSEIAETIYFLGSDQNTYMTGTVLDVNGGMTMP